MLLRLRCTPGCEETLRESRGAHIGGRHTLTHYPRYLERRVR